MLKVIPVTSNVIDVFWGEGWYNWERLRQTKNKDGSINLSHLAGKQLPKVQKVQLYFLQSPKKEASK